MNRTTRQHPAFNVFKKSFSQSSVPAALYWRKLACFISVVTSLIFFPAFHAQADVNICSPERVKERDTSQQDAERLSDKLKGFEVIYYITSDKAEQKKARDKYIDMWREIDDVQYQKFVTDICARKIILPASGSAEAKAYRKSYVGFEAILLFRRLQALHSAKIANTRIVMEAAKNKSIDEYSLMDAKYALSDVDWTLMLYTAISEVEKIKLEALGRAAAGVPAKSCVPTASGAPAASGVPAI